MKSRIATCCVVASLVPAMTAGQSTGERLTLESAIRIAVENNRQLQSARLQVEKAEEDVATARTRRLPAFETQIIGSQLITPVKFGFPQGAFGEFPGAGPIPATDTSITVPQQPTAFVSASVSQPLSQLNQINIGVRNAEKTRQIEGERLRAAELSIVNGVKRLYFAILQSESALASGNEAVAVYRELDRTLQVRVVQKVALQADAFDVQFRLAQEELAQTTRRNTLASQKEQLNQILGRDVRTPFDVDNVSDISALE